MKDYYEEISHQPLIEQLQQLTHLTWDGDLVSKKERDNLVHAGYAYRIKGGWNLITEIGINYLESGKFIHPLKSHELTKFISAYEVEKRK